MRAFDARACFGGGHRVEWGKGSFYKQYGALAGFSATTAGVPKNIPVVAMMIPMAVEAAQITGAEPFSFVLAVTFAASGALLTPIGYQTDLMAYGPGGYRFTNFLWMGTPLRVLLALVTCGEFWAIWGV